MTHESSGTEIARFARAERVVERRWLVVAATACALFVAACGGATSVAPDPIDVDAELDRLFACGAAALVEDMGGLERTQPAIREAVGGWLEAGEDRVQLTVRVWTHPMYGPGVTVTAMRQSWAGVGTPRADARVVVDGTTVEEGHWRLVPPQDEDRVRERAIVSATTGCWERARAVTGEGP